MVKITVDIPDEIYEYFEETEEEISIDEAIVNACGYSMKGIDYLWELLGRNRETKVERELIKRYIVAYPEIVIDTVEGLKKEIAEIKNQI